MNYSQRSEHETPVSQLFSAAFVSLLIIMEKKKNCNLLMRVNYKGEKFYRALRKLSSVLE